MEEYECVECGEELSPLIACVNHNSETKHKEYLLLGTDIIRTVEIK